jgi:methyltransferase (TIGR00027 family)
VLKGTVQYVLLGAGLDTFSYRNPYPELRVFEVDQPETQRWKRGLIASGGLSTERSPTYLALDFELEELLGRLVEVGFDAQKKTLFAWLGVVPYLTQGTFRSVLDLISGMPPGSGLVADYLQPRDVLPISEQQALDSIASRVREAGEPFRLFLTQGEIKDELVSFSELDDLGAEEINAMYFSGRDDLLAVRGAASRLIRAWV